MYLIIETGVFRQRVMGLYTEIETATERAQEIYDNDDEYHNIYIHEINVDEDIDDVPDTLIIKQKSKPKAEKVKFATKASELALVGNIDYEAGDEWLYPVNYTCPN